MTTDDNERRVGVDYAISRGVDPEVAAEALGVDSKNSLVLKALKLPEREQFARALSLSVSNNPMERDAGLELARRQGIPLPQQLVPGFFTQMSWQIQDAIARGMSQAGTTVKVGSDTVARAHANAPSHRTRLAH